MIAESDGTTEIITFVEPTGKRYEDRYGQYLDFFKRIAESPLRIRVINAPWTWVPLLKFLNCEIRAPIRKWKSCELVRRMLYLGHHSVATGEINTYEIDRLTVETLCGFRPELVDALYKIDMQWTMHVGRTISYASDKEFLVTNNGSFHRHEVRAYLNLLKTYEPTKKKVVLVPCAADKPYPANLHKLILDIMPSDYYMAIATGVLGIVPQDLWHVMPWYDSGIPNQWRLFEIAGGYFKRHMHDRIVVYCDFYAHVLQHVFQWNNTREFRFVLPPKKYDDYVDLQSEENLAKLKQAFAED